MTEDKQRGTEDANAGRNDKEFQGSGRRRRGASEKEAVKVVVRCRPFSEKEKAAGHSNVVTINKEAATVGIIDPKAPNDPLPKTFTFDSVFDIQSTQQEVYNKTARPIVESVLAGYNGTIFAYGQTGTGKTFSMEGIRDVPELRGIIPNAFEHIFAEISMAEKTTQFLVRASYLEIYNEDIIDLLNPKAGKLEVKERADTGIYVKDLRTFVIKDVEEMDRLMSFGNKNRSVGATEMNATSSRSHSIFSITVEASEKKPDGEEHIRAGKLHLVDLAGSERQGKTGATGERLKEAAKINLSLSALGNVISALVDGKSSHIPYRDSKLTRLLQDSLGGNAKTLMVATMSPASYNYDETVSTLRYANRTKNIKNKPKINEDPKDAMLREFQEEIKRLKEQLDQMDSGGAIPGEESVVQEVEEIEEVEEVEDVEAPAAARKTKGEKAKKAKVKKPKTASKSAADTTSGAGAGAKFAHPDHEKMLADMQAQVEAEKRHILESKDIEETERDRLMQDLNARAGELDAEREARDQLTAKLSQLEQKLLIGGVNAVDKHEEQKLQLAKQQQEVEERARRERELARELEEHDEAGFQIEEEFSSLQEEAAAKTKKLKKLWTLLMRHKSEIKDLQEEHQREREQLLDTVRDLSRELKLRMLVLDSFVPRDSVDLLESFAEYDEASEKWRVAHIAHAGNNIRGKRSLVSGLPLHRDQYGPAGDQGMDGQEPPWSPMVAFPDPYLSYEASSGGGSTRRKVPAGDASKKGSGGSERSPKKSGRPASAVAKRPKTKGGGDKRHASGYASPSVAQVQDDEKKPPSARGLVGKTKHYA
ncbi:P-loop containing nucleoside triphosphate hydrolase protein [Geranomyces variabilis]|nr:P-loop containing nucleoside triphosphate hydrolase protein [Geranomyces variabilis]